MKIVASVLFCMILCIPVAGRIPDAAATNTAPLTDSRMKCDASFFVTAERALKILHDKKKIVFIDVRQKSDFDRVRISGSLNIPPHAIKTKAFLKSKALILVNEGHRYSPLEQECRHLRQAGFNVRILKGGLYSWKRSGGMIEGEHVAGAGLNQISSLNYFYEKDRGDWVVINALPPKDSGAGSALPGHISIPFEGNGNHFVSEFKKFISDKKTNPCTRILVFDEKGETYGRMEPFLQKAGIDILFLEGGIQAYRKVVEHQKTTGRNLTVYGKSPKKKCAACR